MDQLAAAHPDVRDHMRLECEGDWDGVIATFAIRATNSTALAACSTARRPCAAICGVTHPVSRSGQRDHRDRRLGDSVLVEFWLTGTHLGPLRTPKGEIAPTGKRSASA